MPTILIHLKNSLTQNIVIKAFSLIIGYGIWSSLAPFHTAHVWLTIPVCFYGPEKKLHAPEAMQVHLVGNRYELALIDAQSLAVHINTDLLQPGPNAITIKNSNLFLPKAITVIHCNPSNSIVTVLEDPTHPLTQPS